MPRHPEPALSVGNPRPESRAAHTRLVLPSKCVRSAPSSLPRRVLDPLASLVAEFVVG